ncbi:MAG TPA: hypothetical protein DDZ65_00935, partial [Firmicutes bacterium]|nr:hypothetical protein [Bacillota bacterium]
WSLAGAAKTLAAKAVATMRQTRTNVVLLIKFPPIFIFKNGKDRKLPPTLKAFSSFTLSWYI